MKYLHERWIKNLDIPKVMAHQVRGKYHHKEMHRDEQKEKIRSGGGFSVVLSRGEPSFLAETSVEWPIPIVQC